jgi:DNA-3-methyladenine glycosylase
MKLDSSFYRRDDVVQIARELLGMYLFSCIDGQLCGGRIVETEAYHGRIDKACHAYNGRRTDRTEIMYAEGGLAYVYLIYGIHHLFNIVTNEAGKADAVLIRAIEPSHGLEIMSLRRGVSADSPRLSSGPGLVSQALGINRRHYGLDLGGNTIWVEDRQDSPADEEVLARPRVGVAYAQEDAWLPWRFSIRNNDWVSKTISKYGSRPDSTR